MVSWAEPGHPGPDIADYDLRYRIGGSSDEFTDAEYAGDQTTVTGLDAILTHVAPGGGYNNPIGGTARVAAQAAKTTLWSATLTVGKHSDNPLYGLGRDSDGTTYGTIDPDSFTHDGTTYNIRSLTSSQGISNTTLFFGVRSPLGFQNLMPLTVGGRDFAGSAAEAGSENTTFTWDTNPALTSAAGNTVVVSLKATVPGKPGKPVATAGPGKVDLTWANPNDASITEYQYRQKKGSGAFGNWKTSPAAGRAPSPIP